MKQREMSKTTCQVSSNETLCSSSPLKIDIPAADSKYSSSVCPVGMFTKKKKKKTCGEWKDDEKTGKVSQVNG